MNDPKTVMKRRQNDDVVIVEDNTSRTGEGSSDMKKDKKRKVVEERRSVEDLSSQQEAGKGPVTDWEDIGEEELLYLAETREKAFEVLGGNVRRRDMRRLGDSDMVEVEESFSTYARENLEELQMFADKPEMRKYSWSKELQRHVSLMTFQHARQVLLLEEYKRRSQWRKAKAVEYKGKMIDLEEEVAQLRARLAEIEERNSCPVVQKDVPVVEKRDAATATSQEEEDMEVVEEETSPDLPDGLLRTIEEVFDKRIDSFLARLGGVLPLPPGPCGAAKETRRNGEATRPQPSQKEGAAQPGTWAQVTGKKKGREKRPPPQEGASSDKGRAAEVGAPPVSPTEAGARNRRRKKTSVWPSLPRTEAVLLTPPIGAPEEMGDLCANVLHKAQREVSLEGLGIPHLEIKRSRTGGYLLGVPGDNSGEKANRLADILLPIADPSGVRVTRPNKRADIRLFNLNSSASSEEVISAFTTATGCRKEECKWSQVRVTPAGVGSMWIQCPLETALKVAKEGRMKVGWVLASVELLKARPQRCFKCLEVGHLRPQCTSEEDRGQRCYRCAATGHRAANCRAEVPRCPLCVDKGRPQEHALGGPGCINAPIGSPGVTRV
jgi:hypothetical protein